MWCGYINVILHCGFRKERQYCTAAFERSAKLRGESAVQVQLYCLDGRLAGAAAVLYAGTCVLVFLVGICNVAHLDLNMHLKQSEGSLWLQQGTVL
jgi:hypothetical protein